MKTIVSLLQASRINHNLFFDKTADRAIEIRENLKRVKNLMGTMTECYVEMRNILTEVSTLHDDTIIAIKESKEKEECHE